MAYSKLHSQAGTVFILGLMGAWLCAVGVAWADRLAPQADIEVFTREGCPHCEAAKIFLEALRRERPGLRIVMREVGDPAAMARLKDLAAQHGVQSLGVPVFHLRGELIVGFLDSKTTGAQIKALLDRPGPKSGEGLPAGACPPEAATPCATEAGPPESDLAGITMPFFGRVTVQQVGLPLFTFAIGLLDGFNPCSMWVLVFMLSMLAGLRDRVKMLLIAGTFVAVEGLAYFAFMAAWLNLFMIIGLSRPTEVVLGGIASLAGVVNVKEYWAYGRGLSLSIPQGAKPGLYARLRGILQAENLTAALVGTVVFAVLVQVVELLCTAGFPALFTRILTMQQLEGWAYYGYLGLYNVAYMLDDVMVLAIGVITLSRERLQEKEGRWLKLISGMVMIGLGVVLIGKPEWLAW
jgi:glutaredoxin